MGSQTKLRSKFSIIVFGLAIFGFIIFGMVIVSKIDGGSTAGSATLELTEAEPSTGDETGNQEFDPQAVSTLENATDGAILVFVPGGSFEMGAEPAEGVNLCQQERDDCQESWFENEGPVHTVTLDAFWMYQTEVTNAMYRLCVQASACEEPSNTRFFNDEGYSDHPVVYVSWQDAVDYCEWSGGRLPTEAEWEKAARGGLEDSFFPWGNASPTCETGAENGAQYDACGEHTLEAASFGPNGYGLYDMAGNAWEWVGDWYSEDYYQLSPAQNPTGPESGNYRVLRGGSWFVTGWGIRSASRFFDHPLSGIGFRCVRDD
jgi:formylglycine-generating enzyme required for sulfatase activity